MSPEEKAFASDFYLRKVLTDKSPYHTEAYPFMLEALNFTLKKLKAPRHLSAVELLEGIRRYAIKLYGPMAKTVLEEWGIQSCKDFGEIVFHLVDLGFITKSETDSKDDFKVGYDFQEAFEKPFSI